MSSDVDLSRRHFLTVATTVTGTVGVVLATVPFVSSWKPSARALAIGAPVEVDISKIDPGSMVAIKWRGRAVWVLHRTPRMIANLTRLRTNFAIRFRMNLSNLLTRRTSNVRSGLTSSC